MWPLKSRKKLYSLGIITPDYLELPPDSAGAWRKGRSSLKELLHFFVTPSDWVRSKIWPKSVSVDVKSIQTDMCFVIT